MLDCQKAWLKLREAADKVCLEEESISVTEALGRISSRDLISPECIPAFASSSMDGFAVPSAATAAASHLNPLRLKILGTIAAGDSSFSDSKYEDGAWEIMTGAGFPYGFDACIKVEDAVLSKNEKGESQLEIREPILANSNLRKAGEDLQIGTLICGKGSRIMAEHILALAAVGLSRIQVFRKIKIGIISTGNEIVEMDDQPRVGEVRNSTLPYLLTTLRSHYHCEAQHIASVKDDPKNFEALLTDMHPDQFDIILTTGAVSAGKFDFVRESLENIGAEIIFHKLAIRPGKPILFAKMKSGPVIFALPGNPVSGVIALRFFIHTFLQSMHKRDIEKPMLAPLAQAFSKAKGLRTFLKARLDLGIEGTRVEILSGQMSFMVGPLLAANAWVVLPEEVEHFSKGQLVEVYPLHPGADTLPERQVRVKMFGAFRELVPNDLLSMQWSEAPRVRDIKQRICAELKSTHGQFDVQALIDKAVIATDLKVLDDHEICHDTDLSILPPVCGG